ncbi:hypothetical protein [Bradyrhizobium betae]|uniref:Uncharacterized protein n=1 Tax=Bradyrhizobium betae TaxID=244734 RepID=A0A5P6PAK3_9BRAD|nr:hypothetical protein [Bradyrhizobium betae]MCS3726690.1 hypothetical protein [Bradyrhizobium betae]QFI75350.1 hypothetical protein F8237_24845 [Bradyrhizobium betae]
MATHIVMDHSGDMRHHFDPADAQASAEARHRFETLVAAGFTAAVRTRPGDVRLLTAFDPQADETVFFPRLVGG